MAYNAISSLSNRYILTPNRKKDFMARKATPKSASGEKPVACEAAVSGTTVVDAGNGGHMNIPKKMGQRVAIRKVAKGSGLDLAEIRARNQEEESHLPEVYDLVEITLRDRKVLASMTPDEMELLDDEMAKACSANEEELARVLQGGEDVPRKWQRAAHVRYISVKLGSNDFTNRNEVLDMLARMCKDKILSGSEDDSGALQAFGIRFYSPKDSTGKALFRAAEIKEIQIKLDALIATVQNQERQAQKDANRALMASATLRPDEFKAGKPGRILLNAPPINDREKDIWYPGMTLLIESDGIGYKVIQAVGNKSDEYEAATMLGMEGLIADLDACQKPPYPGVPYRISWLQFFDRNQQQTGKWLMQAEELRKMATISTLEFLQGKDGLLFVTIPAIIESDRVRFYGGGCLFAKNGNNVSLKAVTQFAAIASDCNRLITDHYWISFASLQPMDFDRDGSKNFPCWPMETDDDRSINFLYALLKSGLWHVRRIGTQMLWYQVRQALIEAERVGTIDAERAEMAKKATITPQEFFLDGKDGSVLLSRESDWDDKQGKRRIPYIFALVSRQQNSAGKIIVLQEVARHVPDDFLTPCLGKHFPDGDNFGEVDQPLAGLLRDSMSQAKKMAAIQS